MSCLPLFSFSPILPSILQPYDALSSPSTIEHQPSSSPTASDTLDATESLYDKLSRVSTSHRRVDSFEWVMTQSAPNTPPTSHDPMYERYSPPPLRRVGSAPLPVPEETRSNKPQTSEGGRKRGYFDWLSSPMLANNNGYAKLSTVDEDRPSLEGPSFERDRVSVPSRPRLGIQAPTSPYSDHDGVRPSQELNALGIVFPCTPPPTPPASDTSRTPSSKWSPPAPAPRLSKRVSFSPIVSEAAVETFPQLRPTHQPSLSWGSYLPSSFLVARPPLVRTTSNPTPRQPVTARPILKRSASTFQHTVHQPMPSTEMKQIAPKADEEEAVAVASPIPVQRLSSATMRHNGHRLVADKSSNTDSAFVAMLRSSNKPPRRRCDSLLSDTSFPVLDECRSC